MPQHPLLDLSLCTVLFFACLYDLSQRRIPNRLLALALVAAFGLHAVLATPLALISTALAGFVTGLVMFLPLYVAHAMAAGDVKLMATVGAFTGPALCFEIGLATYCAGGLLAIGMIVAKGHARIGAANVAALIKPLFLRMGGVPLVSEPLPHPSVGNMPYAVAITAGTLTMLWIRHT